VAVRSTEAPLAGARGLRAVTAISAIWRSVTPLVIAVAVTVLYAVYVLWRLRLMGKDPSFFVVAGPMATDPLNTLPNLHVFPPGTTYDGQFFYRLALEPWTSVQTGFGITLDMPAYRQQRILYPLIAWGISMGMWQFVPAALIIANLLAIGALAYAAAAYAVSVGRHALASVVVPFYAGYVVTISRDLAELTEAALLTAGLVLIQRGRFVAASAALTVGVFAKETLLGVPIAGVILWAIRRASKQRGGAGPPLMTWIAPLAAYAGWSVVMAARWGATGAGQGSVNFGLPLVGFIQHVQTLAEPSWAANRVELGLLVLMFGAVTVVLGTYRRRIFSTGVLPFACVLYAMLALVYASYIWQDAYAYLRALHELFLTAALALLAVSVWPTRVLGLATVALWVAFALQTGGAP
jgi:hypothetical protein